MKQLIFFKNSSTVSYCYFVVFWNLHTGEEYVYSKVDELSAYDGKALEGDNIGFKLFVKAAGNYHVTLITA